MRFAPVIGLEIHAELKTQSKMFCDSLNDSQERHPNINICPICMGHPGTLPVINEDAVKKTIKTGLALGCKIAESSKFDRKNYFYPDLPKGYQISQYDSPLCGEGFLAIGGRKIKIRRIHLEEDTGRLVHEQTHSLVDFNRAGVPLMELVTEPDIHSAVEAKKFAEELQVILRYLGVSEANMEKGQMRVEANVSLAVGKKLGTKVEVKNLNSFRSVERAINYEIARQAELLEGGKKVLQETRGWNEIKEETKSQRVKEEAQDYRYFPEPDLLPLSFRQKDIAAVKKEIPELPQQRRQRFRTEYGLGEKEIEVFVQNKDFGEYFEKAVSELRGMMKKAHGKKLAKTVSNYMLTDLLGLLEKASVTDEDFNITPENFAEFTALIHEGKISSKMAKQVLAEMFASGKHPQVIVKEKQLIQVTDSATIEKIVKEVLAKNPKAVDDFYKGNTNAFQFLVGQVMAATRGKASPDLVNKIMRKLL